MLFQLKKVKRQQLSAEGIDVSVVSMPSMELFEAQTAEYKESVLPKAVKKRVAIEAGSPFGWDRYTKCHGKVIAIDHFGASAPGDKVLAEFGFTTENVVETFKSL